MKDKIIKIFKEYDDGKSFSGIIESCEELINQAEVDLEVNLPEEYKWFLRNYGQGGIDGLEIIGIGSTKIITFRDKTLEFREKYNLPPNLVVIENCDEYYYCIDCNTYKIVNWSIHEDEIYIRAESFFEYLEDSLNEVIDNIDD